jgi:hypothetical protein
MSDGAGFAGKAGCSSKNRNLLSLKLQMCFQRPIGNIILRGLLRHKVLNFLKDVNTNFLGVLSRCT